MVFQCRDKSRTLSQKQDKWASRENCDFFPGHVVKSRDCPGKSGTDGHLTLTHTVPPTVAEFGQRAFSFAGPTVWNFLPSNIRHITGTAVFKRHLKTHLLNP